MTKSVLSVTKIPKNTCTVGKIKRIANEVELKILSNDTHFTVESTSQKTKLTHQNVSNNDQRPLDNWFGHSLSSAYIQLTTAWPAAGVAAAADFAST